MSDQTIKNEQMRLYDSGRLYTQADLQDNIINTQEILPSYPPTSYEQSSSQQDALGNVYMGKPSRLSYVNTPKIVTQADACYPKYNNTGEFVHIVFDFIYKVNFLCSRLVHFEIIGNAKIFSNGVTFDKTKIVSLIENRFFLLLIEFIGCRVCATLYSASPVWNQLIDNVT